MKFPVLPDKVYDVLKYVAQIVLPGVTTFWLALAGIWGFPYAEQIGGTLAAIDTLLGTLLCLSTAAYNAKKGDK